MYNVYIYALDSTLLPQYSSNQISQVASSFHRNSIASPKINHLQSVYCLCATCYDITRFSRGDHNCMGTKITPIPPIPAKLFCTTMHPILLVYQSTDRIWTQFNCVEEVRKLSSKSVK